MDRGLFCLSLVLGMLSCASRREGDLLDREIQQFKVENERIRAEDLEELYQSHKRKADALAEDLLAVQRQREADYVRYDALRKEIADLRRELPELTAEREALVVSLQAERVRVEELRRSLAEERARLRALESGAEAGESAPE